MYSLWQNVQFREKGNTIKRTKDLASLFSYSISTEISNLWFKHENITAIMFTFPDHILRDIVM